MSEYDRWLEEHLLDGRVGCTVRREKEEPVNDNWLYEIMKGLKKYKSLEPENVIYHDPATIILWNDGTKTVVKCHDGDTYDPVVGFLLCVMKRFYGNKSSFNDILKRWIPENVASKSEPDSKKWIPENVASKENVEKVTQDLNDETLKTEISFTDFENCLAREREYKAQIKANDEASGKTNEEKIDILDKARAREEKIKSLKSLDGGRYIWHPNPAYPGLEKFCSDNDFSYRELNDLCDLPENTIARVMRSNGNKVRKSTIDKILAGTGLKYAEAFGA